MDNNTLNLTYRIARQEDLNQIVTIYNSTISSRMVTADTEEVTVESKQDWFEAHNPNSRPLWVIENEFQQTIGWLSFQSFYGRPAYNATVEMSIYIALSSRGKGIGKRAMQFAIQQAPKFNIKTLLGFIFAHNEPSLKLFKHFGFQEWANLPNIALLDNTEKSLIILGKRII